jgi:hypothetical protein
MLTYTSFDEAWGQEITPKVFNPYNQEADLAEERRARRSDTDVCRHVLTNAMLTQGPVGVRRLMGPEMCKAMDMHTSAHLQHTRRKKVTFSQDDLMFFLLIGLLILLIFRS